MAFDVREYVKQRNQNSTDGNTKKSSNFDVQEYTKQRNLPRIREYLNSSINDWLKKNESFINSYNERQGQYQDTDPLNWKYQNDASDWLSSATTQKGDLEKEANVIKSWLDYYKDYLGKDYVSSVTQDLEGNLLVQGQIVSSSTKDYEYWSQWETEDAYNEWVVGQRDLNEKLSFDLGAGKEEVDWLQSVVDEYDKIQRPAYSNTDRGYSAQAKTDAYNAQISAIEQKYGISYEDAKAQLSEKSAYYTLAERAQKAKELASVADPESKNYDPAFAEKSQYQSTMVDNRTWWDDLVNNPSHMRIEYDDPLYEWINGNELVKSDVKDNHRAYGGDNKYDDGKTSFEEAGYDHMTKDEIAIYNYYYNTEGKEKAEEYLDSLEESLQYRLGSDMALGMEGRPVAQYVFAVEAGLDQFATGVSSIFSDEYTPTNATQIASGMVREDLADDSIPLWYNFKEGEWEDKVFGSSLGQVGYDVINTTSNMLPSILASTAVNAVAPGAGAVVGAGLMGASAGGNAKAEMLQLGYSKEQANAYGLMVGVAEAGMEYLLGGISKLGGKASGGLTELALSKVDNAFARTAIKLGGSMLSEGFEEGIQTIIEPWLKEIATSVDWEDPSVDEVLYSSLLGALSALGLEGAGTVVGEVNTYRQGQKVRKVDGGVGKLQSIGSTFSADTVAYKIASKVDAFTDAYTIGRLLNEVGGTISEQNLTDIVNGLTAKGMDTKTATKLAKQYQAMLNSEMNISDEQVKILENLSPLADVLRTNIIGSNTTVYQRTRAYADIMSLADEVANGKKSKATETAPTEKSTDTVKSSMNIFDQQAMEAELKKVASDVASGSRTSMAGRVLKESVNSASEAAAEKLGVEGKYTSSETGATRLASNKKKVNIVGVDSIEDGVMKVKLNDGSVVDADEIDFSSSDEALVYEAVTNMGVSPTTAWEILKAYNPKSGQSGTIYAMGALEAYTYGHNGVKADGMSQKGFSALLSDVQKNTANRLGDIDAKAKVEAQQKNIDKAVKSVRDEAKSKHKAIPRRKGETVFEGDRARLTELQEKQLGVLEKIASGLGVTFHIFESKVDAEGKRYYTMPNGKITGANGWYDPKTGEIWIDLHAGNDGQGTMIFTAAHELTHFIRQWSPAKFKIFADFLFEQYGKKGQDVNQLIRDQIKKAADNGRSISWDEAYEEVIADSCETFLRDSKAAEKISALREKDAGLANKIKSFLGQMLAKMRKLMADLGLAPETKEGKMVAEMTDSIQKLYDLWTDALADAGQAYSTLAEIDFDTDSVAPMLSERTWTASEYVTEREETAKKISKALGVDMKTAYKYIDDINSVARLIADDRARLDYEPNLDEHATVLKPNSDYKYSVDMSTLCAKRLLFTGTFDAIQRALPNTVFDSEDIVALREMMQQRGYEVACGICYVESTRREIGRITQDFINSYKESQKTGKPITRTNSEGKVIDLKKTNDEKKATADKSTDKFFAEKDYTPTLADLNTTDIDLVKRDHPLVYEAYLNFMNARGQAKPKFLETRAEYKGEILTHFKAKNTVTARNNAGGLRLQSFSDFEVPHLIDMMQIVMDMSRVGLKSQAYTKVPAFAEIFGDTGVKINLSLIAKGDGLDANGNLVFDDVEGINHKEAFKLRDKYSKNVGTILVGKTDAHIIAAMADPRIDYIIPFHKSSWKESLYDALGLTGYADYTDTQHERAIDKNRGKIKDFDPSEYWDFSKSGDENAQIYLEKCREDGRIPKFPQFQGYPGYWKLLIDFKMYDNDGVGSPQEVVRPTFNMEASERILSEYKGGHKSFPVAKDVVEDFVKEHKDKAIRYSFRDSKNGMANDALVPYNEEQTRFINQRGDYIIDSFEKLIEIVNLAFDQPNLKAIAHFGMVDAATLQKIKNSIPNLPESMDTLFTDNRSYSIATTLDGIRHIVKEKNLTRQDVIDYLDRFADTIVEYDEVDFHYYTRRGRQMPGLLFRKDFSDGKYFSFDLVSQEKQSLLMQSLYIDSVDYEKRKSADPVLMHNAPASTPKARGGQTSTNRIAQKPNSVNSKSTKNSLRNVESIETSDYVKMYHHFGSTKNYDVAGYILGNGMMLDFSGKHWGDDYSTSRQVDHRDIQEVLGNRGSNNGVNAMIDMIGNGNIRLMPEVGGINLAVKPNATQMSQLRGYINHFKGEVTIDIDAVGGDTIHSFNYTRGTSSAKVLADIKAYFDEGIVPEQKTEGDTDIHRFLFSERASAPPTKTKKAYKLMRLVDGKLYPLFIGNNEEISVGTWYNADSPNLSQLKNLAPGTHLVDMKTGEAMSWDEYAEKYVPKKNGKPARSKPSKDDVHWANDNGYRFMHIEEKAGGKSEGTMLKKYGDTRAYYNWGVNGSSKTESGEGSASLYALRPGWHFGEVPSMHQIGYDGEEGETVRLDNQVWVEVEMSADVDYNAEAEANWSGDIPTHIPTNGYYRYATNPTQKKTKGGNTSNDATKADWFVAGAFKVNRILSDSEADSIVENYNKANGKNVPLDYRRNYGRVFNAETMRIEDSKRYSDRVLMGSLFSGGGTLEAGLVYQMLDKEFAVEYNKKIAATYTDNHGKEHMFVGDVRDFNSKDKQNVFYLHASPVCKNFSPASHSGGETTLDITTAQATARVLEEQMPQVFTVENVKRYIGSEAYNIIVNKLNELGYTWDVGVYKASDYGNATKRERMIIRAVKDGELPAKPQKVSQITSWGEATRDLWETDLIPSTLVRSKIEAIKNTPQLKGIKFTKLDKPLLIYDTTKSKTVSFAWADELAPTLTTKCGDARIIMPDGRAYAPTPRLMGRIQGLPDDYKYPKASTNAFKIIGNGIPTQLTKAVMGGVLDSAYEQTHDGKVLYSDRSPSAVSTRTLLANALETTAQNDIERSKLEQYKSKIDLIESEYAKLTEIRAKIKELSFAKGARDTKAIKDLQFQANQTANRINTYDRQLLNLESTTALKNVLQREKKLAYDKAKKEGKDALSKYKERAAKTQRELMNRNTESRQKAIEGRDKTAMRHKIRNIVDDLNKLLLNPTKDKHIPISLQKPVASALAVINMDTVGADERIAKYNELIAKAKDPDEIARLTKSRDNIELQGENLKDKLTVLQNAYAALLKSDDPLIKNAHDEAIENLIANTVDKVGDTSIRNMSLEQLEAVYDMFKAIKATVRNTNKMFKEGKQETVTANSEWAKREISAVGGHRDRVLKATKFLKKFGWNMLKPIYAMKLIGSDILTSLYENVRKGEDTWAVDVNEAKDFFKETAKKYEYNTWDFKKQYKFKDSAGHSFSLSIEQIMSLYAYSKRNQADLHLELGGFVFDDSIEVTKKNKLGIPMKYEVNDANPYRLKKEDLNKVISILDTDLKNVKGFVDEMQAYLSDVMGAKGNEVSLAMYDIKLYKEQNYFPLKSAKYFREFDPEKNGTPKIKNSGFSKNTVPQAGNPIVLSNFMDVWANHVNDMSMYHAFVLPLEDFMRVYNYSSTAGGYDSVQQYIKNAYGVQANSYIEALMNDLNGGARSDPATDLISKGMSLFKKAAVFASASVVIQQPSAIARALAYIDAKYFVDKPEASKHSETWAEVKKYAPVAIIKEMGYFDTNMGRSTVDWIKEEKTWRDKVDDVASKAPALADELAWCAIWKAVKREIADSTNLKVGSEEFLQMAGKRFTEVVTKTQVYDSVLSRSALMRSKDSGAKMITAFMAEPTTSLNMVVDAIIEGKRGNKKFVGKAIGAVAASIILNSILVSLVTAARDDDDDETYTEKYLESLTAELLDGFNPLTYIPLVKDIWSIMQGYDVERSDMSIWSDLWQSVENLFSDNKSGFEKTEGVVGSIASIFGLPAKNLMRDARAMFNLASTLLSGTSTTWAGVGEAVGGAVKSSIPLYSRIEKWAGANESKSDKLYDAIMSGDQSHIDRVKAQYSDDQAVESAIKQALRDNDSRIKEAAKAHASGDIRAFSKYIDTIVAEGHFDEETVEGAIRAEESAFNTKVNKAAEAKNKGDEEEYKKLVRELRDSYKGVYSQDDIVNLVKKAQDELLKTNDDEDADEATSVYKASDINDAFENGDTDMALEVIDDLFNTKVANGMTEKEAKSSIRSSMTSYWKPLYKEAYKSGNTSEKERIERILKASGLYGNAKEVIETVRKWRTEKD